MPVHAFPSPTGRRIISASLLLAEPLGIREMLAMTLTLGGVVLAFVEIFKTMARWNAAFPKARDCGILHLRSI
jgi:hypothetical protein